MSNDTKKGIWIGVGLFVIIAIAELVQLVFFPEKAMSPTDDMQQATTTEGVSTSTPTDVPPGFEAKG